MRINRIWLVVLGTLLLPICASINYVFFLVVLFGGLVSHLLG